MYAPVLLNFLKQFHEQSCIFYFFFYYFFVIYLQRFKIENAKS